MLRVASLNPSLMAQRYLNLSSRDVESAFAALASGSRFSKPGNDAAGFAISESLRGQVAGTRQAGRNAQAAMAMVQTAEGGLNEQNNILIRMRELAVQAASDTYGENEREFMDTEFQQLAQEFDRIAKTTVYGQKNLLTGSGESFDFQVGAFKGEENVIRFSLDSNTTSSNLELDGLSVADDGDAEDALASIDEGISGLGKARADFGAIQSRLQHAIDHLAVQGDNLDMARSYIADADIGEQVSKLANAQIRQDAGVAVLAQANNNPKAALRLIG
ncbi:MAG: flagellin FliC [Bdellovibrionaceae bacterium]|nr:flagellin FliC [Pseudobdellovibrionaceae bacterium]|tara:strand:+ start:3083 stop:3907 length:825 start_codon:yes stop_codon:yes gene_type:complete